ncbi:MAG: AAA family ATPase [Thaumarchaeota archaeon]|nr:AAA family ATPase [Nitrososphaerota archaeon]
MKIETVEAQGFRGLVSEKFPVSDLSVFYGEMGSGKTSKLLAIFYCVTGSAPEGLSLDELINVHSDFMWVKISGNFDGAPFSIERRKRRGLQSTVKTDLAKSPVLDQKIFIDGRQIADLLSGAPAEKAVKLDALLGISHFDEVTKAITAAPVERRKADLEHLKSAQGQILGLADEVVKAEKEKSDLTVKMRELDSEVEQSRDLSSWAEGVLAKAEDARRRRIELDAKLNESARIRAKLASLPPFPIDLEDAVQEAQAKQEAMQRRLAFLESAMQTLDLAGKKVEEITTCPLCGSQVSPGSLSTLRHYGEEYEQVIPEAETADNSLRELKAKFEKAKREREEANALRSQLSSIEKQVAELSVETVSQPDVQKATQTNARRDALQRDSRDIKIKLSTLEDKLQSYARLSSQSTQQKAGHIEESIAKLNDLKAKLEKIKVALTEAVNEVRAEQFDRLKTDFREAFSRIYPYPRFSDIDFERLTMRGREVLTIKAKVDGGWIYSNQMSTGENVAISFALLYAVNKLEKAPILLLDEPDEGLDPKGVEGLVDVLNRLKVSTQIVVATRNQQLANLFSSGAAAAVVEPEASP